MTDEVTAEGYYRLTHHHLIEFCFLDVTQVQLDGFNHQNVLSEIAIEAIEGQDQGIRVELEHCFGVSATFAAKSGHVVSVIPCSSEGVAHG